MRAYSFQEFWWRGQAWLYQHWQWCLNWRSKSVIPWPPVQRRSQRIRPNFFSQNAIHLSIEIINISFPSTLFPSKVIGHLPPPIITKILLLQQVSAACACNSKKWTRCARNFHSTTPGRMRLDCKWHETPPTPTICNHNNLCCKSCLWSWKKPNPLWNHLALKRKIMGMQIQSGQE